MKILIVEDEPDMLKNMADSLRKENYLIEVAEDYETAMEKVCLYSYDCILLDIGLPGGNGLGILKELKNQDKTEGIIIVSAKDSLDDKVKGLNLGADDYLPKPFHLAELLARVKAVFRRKKMNGNKAMTFGNLKVYPEERIVSISEEEINLNRKEYDILLYMLSNKNRLITKTALAEHVWGDQIDETDSFEFIYSQIKNLRKKLKNRQADIEVQAIYGIGYKILAK